MSEAAEEAKKEAAKQAVGLVFAVAGLIIFMAMQDRDFLKIVQMRTAMIIRDLTGMAARRTGRTSMGVELRTGHEEYSIPYFLSKLRDRAKAWYERLVN